jgi:tripartite-type tricarboxylate transporter receptor subunit TctC
MKPYLAAAAAVLMSFSPANAQDTAWAPTRTVRIIVPFQAGGPIDTIARILSQHFNEQWGQPFVVENRTGAGGNIGSDAVAKATPDGYTLGLASGGTHGANVTLFGDKMPYDPVKDFAPVTLLAQMKNVLTVHPSLGVKDLNGFIAKAKSEKEALSFGSAGVGTVQHLTGEMFKVATKLNLVHITYRGQAQALPDLLSGRIAMMFLGTGDAADHIRSGNLIAIGLSASERSTLLPDIVPLSEQGLPGFNATTWFGLVAPAGTPKNIIDAYYQKVVAVLQKDDVKSHLQKLGIDTTTMSPDEFGKFIANEVDKWGSVIKTSGVKLN